MSGNFSVDMNPAPSDDSRYKVPCPCCNVEAGRLCETLQHIPMVLIHKARGDKYRHEIQRLMKQREALRRGY